MTGSVGIKEANGNFYPIVEANKTAKKRLLLTTAHDNQKSVQIDLYKSAVKSMVDAQYIGSVVVENIVQKAKGKASIEMTVSSSPDGTISVDVVETGNPSNEHHLTISLNSLEEDRTDYRDFETDEKKSEHKKVRVKDRNRKFPWIVIIIGVVLALICLALWFLLVRYPESLSRLQSLFTAKTAVSRTASPGAANTTPANTAPEASTGTPAKVEEPPVQTVVIEKAPSPQAAEETVAPSPAASQTQPANQTATGQTAAGQTAPPARTSARTPNRINAPQTIPPEGITYKVRWGDTLWDIAAAFYRNPRLYPLIVRSNNISNPNRIVSGTELIILPRK